jgi:hypothetical protein
VTADQATAAEDHSPATVEDVSDPEVMVPTRRQRMLGIVMLVGGVAMLAFSVVAVIANRH